MSVIAVIFVVSAVLTVCGALAWLGERIEALTEAERL